MESHLLSPLALKKTPIVKFDINLCICQKQGKDNIVSTEHDRKQIMTAAEKRRDDVWKRLKSNLIESEFKYHTNNICYKSYAHKNKLSDITPETEENISEETCNTDMEPP